MPTTSVPVSISSRPLPQEDDLTPLQWEILLSIFDALIPSKQLAGPSVDHLCRRPKTTSVELARQYMAEKPSDLPAFSAVLRLFIFTGLAPSDRRSILRILDALSYTAGSLLLTSTTNFKDQPLESRELVLQSWSRARIPTFRLLYAQLSTIAKLIWVRTSPTLYRVLGYPRVPVDGKVGKEFDFNFIQFPPGDAPEELETDVVIVGSGCGGAVAAKNLAETGLRVLVVEKGYYWAPKYLPMTDEQGPIHLIKNGGGILTDDGSVAVISGETWGGGGAINWSACLEPPGIVRRQWAATGLPFSTSTAFQESIDRCCDIMGVSTQYIKHSSSNRILLEGSRKLGWTHKEIPQNTGGNGHSCGHCFMGCRSGEKHGPVVSWLPQAQAAGAKFIEGLDVSRVLFVEKYGEPIATGVEGVWKSRDEYVGTRSAAAHARRVVIKAKKVLVSCGTLNSPLLLQRSGLTTHRSAATFISIRRGFFVASMTRRRCLGMGHGVKLETTSMSPFSWLTWLPLKSGQDFKELASKLRHMTGYVSVPRDRDSGRVYADPADGRCRIQYSPSQFDRKHIVEGAIALARINYVQSAREIFVMPEGGDRFVRDDNDDPAESGRKFEAWVDRLRAKGYPSPQSIFATAHQMGTYRMSASPKTGVVDAAGRVWGTKGLHVIDASVFPTASGVNPMLTVMSIADYLSRGIADEWSK